jgi:iron complex transport system substrate-binding protein
VVSLSPHFTEIVYDLGAEDRLIAVTDYCRYPPAATRKPKVGGLLNPSLEGILRLKPDLVLAVPFYGSLIGSLRKFGVPVLVLDNSRLSDALSAYDAVGKALGMEQEARAGRRRLEARLEGLRPRGSRTRPTALFVAGTETGTLNQMVAAGRGTFVSELLRKAGFRNILDDVKAPFTILSREELLRRDPDVIFHAVTQGENGPGAEKAYRRLWGKWDALGAVRGNKLYFITRDEWMVPGPSLAGLGFYFRDVRDMLQTR